MNYASIVTTLLAAAGGLFGVFAGARLTHKNQHQMWLSEKKIEAVSAFVENNSLLIDRFSRVPAATATERVEWLHGIQSGRTVINLLCDQETREAAGQLAQLSQQIEKEPTEDAVKRAVKALKDLVDLAREEIQETKKR
jgi:hypothetical protein